MSSSNSLAQASKTSIQEDTVPLKGIHHVHFWVGNAKQASYYYRKAFGFSQKAFSGLETGNREYASYVLQQGEITFVFSTPYSSKSPIADHVRKHGDGVKDIAFHVDDVDLCFSAAIAQGGIEVQAPYDTSDENGTVRKASIATYGDTIHTFISTNQYNGPFLPSYREEIIEEESTGIYFIDHIVGNVEDNKMNQWTNYYATVLGFSQLQEFTDDDISTEYSALMSKVMQNGTGRIKFPINEPAEGKKKSQIQEYVEFYEGAGVQHLALKTDDIIKTISQLRKNGVEFLNVPDTYYDVVLDRVGNIDENFDAVKDLKILIDRDDEGYLLQLFTQPVEDRPTVFFEIIQRKGCKGFGEGNFKALFEAIERVQDERGNL